MFAQIDIIYSAWKNTPSVLDLKGISNIFSDIFAMSMTIFQIPLQFSYISKIPTYRSDATVLLLHYSNFLKIFSGKFFPISPFNPLSPNSRSNANFSFEFTASYVWYM